VKAAGLKDADLHFHDLRHEAASRLLERGWSLQHVQEMLGHADAATTAVYVNATAEQLADSMRRFPAPEPPKLSPAPLQTVTKTAANRQGHLHVALRAFRPANGGHGSGSLRLSDDSENQNDRVADIWLRRTDQRRRSTTRAGCYCLS